MRTQTLQNQREHCYHASTKGHLNEAVMRLTIWLKHEHSNIPDRSFQNRILSWKLILRFCHNQLQFHQYSANNYLFFINHPQHIQKSYLPNMHVPVVRGKCAPSTPSRLITTILPNNGILTPMQITFHKTQTGNRQNLVQVKTEWHKFMTQNITTCTIFQSGFPVSQE